MTEQPVDPADGEGGLIPGAPGPSGTGEQTTAGTDPAAPQEQQEEGQ